MYCLVHHLLRWTIIIIENTCNQHIFSKYSNKSKIQSTRQLHRTRYTELLTLARLLLDITRTVTGILINECSQECKTNEYSHLVIEYKKFIIFTQYS